MTPSTLTKRLNVCTQEARDMGFGMGWHRFYDGWRRGLALVYI